MERESTKWVLASLLWFIGFSEIPSTERRNGKLEKMGGELKSESRYLWTQTTKKKKEEEDANNNGERGA